MLNPYLSDYRTAKVFKIKSMVELKDLEVTEGDVIRIGEEESIIIKRQYKYDQSENKEKLIFHIYRNYFVFIIIFSNKKINLKNKRLKKIVKRLDKLDKLRN